MKKEINQSQPAYEGGASEFGKYFKKVLFGLLFFGLLLTPAFDATASLLDQKRDELNSIRQDVKKYEAEADRYASQANTLQNQVNSLNAQINKIRADIKYAETKIDESRIRIQELGDQIKEQQSELAEQKDILGQAIKYMYEEGETPFIETLFSANTFSQILDRTEYLNTASMRVEKAMGEIEQIEERLKEKRKDQRAKKKEQETLRDDLENRRISLNSTIGEKQYILRETKNKESEYQSLVKQKQAAEQKAQQEINRILSAVNSGRYVSQGRVNRGDVVGYMGSTGFSTGVHLHFEVRLSTSYGSHTNPQPYISNGTFMRPVTGPVTQHYGYTSFARQGWYGGGPHTGIDYGGAFGTPIRAAGSGDIIFRGWLGGYGNTVMVMHDNGMVTLYAHMR